MDDGASCESRDTWGFDDTRFQMHPGGSVSLTGRRYALCGQALPALVPWFRNIMEIDAPLEEVNPPNYPPAVPDARRSAALEKSLSALLAREDQLSHAPLDRLRHGHGHTQEEMYAIKYGSLPRVPDYVVYPVSQEEVLEIVAIARAHDASVIPYGGGTNVTEALQVPRHETRVVISVDMTRMNRVLWVDPINKLACIEAGAVGRNLIRVLHDQGWTMGHEPDSLEFSTLGGWIATHASGMKRNKYGNIEDLVADMNIVTADGLMCREQIAPRESVGVDPRNWIYGSEGSLGIITQAIVKLHPLPEAQRYGSIIFPSFEEGVGFLYNLSQTGVRPASVRLVDNMQFQLSMCLKPERKGLAAFKSRAEKFMVTRVKGFKPDTMCACTLVFEGTTEQVALEESHVYRLAAQHRGLKGGAENGERGYQLTYSIAYIRDFVMNHWVLAESFETSVPWSRILELIERVKVRVEREHRERKLPGKPFITSRVTQQYDTGVAIYFYFAFYFRGVEEPSRIYSEIETAAREEILAAGGSLSHHHGVGKLRQRFVPQVFNKTGLIWRDAMKKALDPSDVFGCGNLVPQKESSGVASQSVGQTRSKS